MKIPTHVFNLPDLGEGLAEAEIREWYVKVGDIVKADQPLVSLETAKAVVDLPSPLAGRIVKLYGNSGDIIQTNTPLVEFQEEHTEKKDKGTVVGQLEESTDKFIEADMIAGTLKRTQSSIKAMPAVRRLAKELNIDLTTVLASGREGQITAEDVKKAAQTHSISKGETLHGVRRAMAIAMSHARAEITPVTIMDDADITGMTKKTDITVCLIQAIVHAIEAIPALNAWYDSKNKEFFLQTEINLGLAMDSDDGLFVPVLKNVAKKTAKECRDMINAFKTSVANRNIASSDLQGATITLSNFGTIAGRYANPIIVPPMVAILGCGKCREEPRVHQGKIEARYIMPLSLTVDHRVITGAEASRFLGAIIHFLEKMSYDKQS